MRRSLRTTLSLLLLSQVATVTARAQKQGQVPPVLVELFTSEGCSSCPPADELLRQVNGQHTSDGALIIGLSEHVSYWNSLGWSDPFSSDVYTQRQSDYSARLRTEGPYTPQMVVNGREQFVGSDRSALHSAFSQESRRKQIDLHITSASIIGNQVSFRYSAAGVPANSSVQLMAALVDDSDRSNVLRGENSGRALTHIFVARTLTAVGTVQDSPNKQVTLTLPAALTKSSQPHHLVIFAQQPDLGSVLGVDARAL